MKELTVNQQEAIDGGWSWDGLENAFAQAGSACDAIGYYCPDLASLTDSVGAACDVASLDVTLSGGFQVTSKN